MIDNNFDLQSKSPPITNETAERERGDISRNVRFGQKLLSVVEERDKGKYTTPFLSMNKLSQDALKMIRVGYRQEQVGLMDVLESILDLSIGVAVSVNEKQVQRGRGVNENGDSLKEVGFLLKNCYEKVREIDEKNPELVTNSIKKIIAREKGVPVDMVVGLGVEETREWVAKQFRESIGRISKTKDNVDKVYSRGW